MDDGLVQEQKTVKGKESSVLILVVVDDGLVLKGGGALALRQVSLNPCCSGRWSRTVNSDKYDTVEKLVLILVVVDDGLVLGLQG